MGRGVYIFLEMVAACFPLEPAGDHTDLPCAEPAVRKWVSSDALIPPKRT